MLEYTRGIEEVADQFRGMPLEVEKILDEGYGHRPYVTLKAHRIRR
jgi:hypothetical protein